VFIFDETRVIGYGSWTHSFLKIASKNKWILLSATPADSFLEFMPLFLANGFYKNKTEFEREHIIWCRFVKYPKVDRYINVTKLIRNRDSILVTMHFQRDTIQHHEDIICDYNLAKWIKISQDRWDIFKNAPIRDVSQLCYTLRKLVNSDPTRKKALNDIFKKHRKLIIFYNFDYELEILREYLNELVMADNICLYDDEVLDVSQRLDNEINDYYI
jgi:hypothetical protein